MQNHKIPGDNYSFILFFFFEFSWKKQQHFVLFIRLSMIVPHRTALLPEPEPRTAPYTHTHAPLKEVYFVRANELWMENCLEWLKETLVSLVTFRSNGPFQHRNGLPFNANERKTANRRVCVCDCECLCCLLRSWKLPQPTDNHQTKSENLKNLLDFVSTRKEKRKKKLADYASLGEWHRSILQ